MLDPATFLLTLAAVHSAHHAALFLTALITALAS